MKRDIELLAPGGDVNSIKAAIAAGADAVYCGLDRFNARNRATNITFDDLTGILRLAHSHNCKVFLTLNIIIVDSEIPALFGILNKLINSSIDGIIVQDLGILYLVSTYFKGLEIHASTQLTTHNEGQILFLNRLNAARVNLSRELNLQEIKALTEAAHKNNMLTEVFVHGSNCISFSGICYMSSVHGGTSGNRGRCSQPCRDQYIITPEGKKFPLNLKDNSAYADLREIADAAVDSIKIEGRIKEFHYVYTVVDSWKKQLRSFYGYDTLISDNSALHQVFNRDFSNAFLVGDINKDMFIDNPRSNTAGFPEKTKDQINDERAGIIGHVEDKIRHLSIAKVPLSISISGAFGTPLKVTVKTLDATFEVLSEINLTKTGTQALNGEMLLKRLKTINETEYFIEHLDLNNLQGEVYLPFKELTSMKRRLLFILNGSKENVSPIAVPILRKSNGAIGKPFLSVLISTQKELYLCDETSATIYFQLPDGFKHESAGLTELFSGNRKIIPWFPAVLIGEDYLAAVEFLHQVKPAHIVTNNTGIAYEAYKSDIPWIAGPFLNVVNSYSLLCLKENFNCSGSFISNEISKVQLQRIKKPEDFGLYYSIYHPVVLLTSRQCLFHQVTGCEKSKIDDACIPQCEKSSSITNLKKVTLLIEKSKGNYHTIYNEINFLNTDIVNDVQNLFSGYFIDLRDIKTRTHVGMDKSGIIRLFEELINGNPGSELKLKQVIHPTTHTQYNKGI